MVGKLAIELGGACRTELPDRWEGDGRGETGRTKLLGKRPLCEKHCRDAVHRLLRYWDALDETSADQETAEAERLAHWHKPCHHHGSDHLRQYPETATCVADPKYQSVTG